MHPRVRQFAEYTDVIRSGTKSTEGAQHVEAARVGQPVFTPIEA